LAIPESAPAALDPPPAPADAPASAPGVALAADASVAGLTCPICHTALASGESIRRCPGCTQVYHDECWTEIGGCGTFGCSHAPAADKSEQSAQAPLTAWGDTKDCPICGETIKSIALKCRYCGATFDSVDPLTAADLRRQAVKSADLATFRRNVVALFAVSLIGCVAPLVAVVAAAYILPRREKLEKCGPLAKIMGWTAIVLSCFYSILMLGFFLASN
jgi:hypothetical protein